MLRDYMVDRLRVRGLRQSFRLWRDEQALTPFDGALAPSYDEWRKACQMLAPFYEHYVAYISSREFPASLEAGGFLFSLCSRLGATSILDVGSGFSSFVFRHFARQEDAPVRVVSVDHDRTWLNRTRGFLDEVGCTSGELVLLSDFNASLPSDQFQLIYNDAWGPLRPDLTLRLGASLYPGGAMVVDDTQEFDNRRALMRVARSQKLCLYDVRPWTYDYFGRWALLAMQAPD